MKHVIVAAVVAFILTLTCCNQLTPHYDPNAYPCHSPRYIQCPKDMGGGCCPLDSVCRPEGRCAFVGEPIGV